jgi:DNA polymerase-3 subunit delta'
MALLKENALERLADAWKAERLAHAYLLTGSEGSGKQWLADRLAAMVLETEEGEVGGHPDFHQVAPESKSRRIVIEQMRTIEQALQMKPMIGKTKVAIVRDADRLMPQAANAFLKTLEEPPHGSSRGFHIRCPGG